MSAARRLLRQWLNGAYYLVGLSFGAHRKLVGAAYFARRLRRSSTLFILAPGASIDRLSGEAIERISRCDAVGISTFIVHDLKPSWWLVEAHPQELGLLTFLYDQSEKLANVQILYKGYNSPARLKNVISNMRQFRRMRCSEFIMLKDAYVRDLGDGATLADALVNQLDDRFYNYIGSVLFCLGLAYKVGYTNVVLCGVDLSTRYFYHENPRYRDLAQKYPFFRAPNIIAKDRYRERAVVDTLADMSRLFAANRRGLVSQLGCDGPLSERLVEYVLCAES